MTQSTDSRVASASPASRARKRHGMRRVGSGFVAVPVRTTPSAHAARTSRRATRAASKTSSATSASRRGRSATRADRHVATWAPSVKTRWCFKRSKTGGTRRSTSDRCVVATSTRRARATVSAASAHGASETDVPDAPRCPARHRESRVVVRRWCSVHRSVEIRTVECPAPSPTRARPRW